MRTLRVETDSRLRYQEVLLVESRQSIGTKVKALSTKTSWLELAVITEVHLLKRKPINSQWTTLPEHIFTQRTSLINYRTSTGYKSNIVNSNFSSKLRINSEASYTQTKGPSLNKTVVVNSQPHRTVSSAFSKIENRKKLSGAEDELRKMVTTIKNG